MQSTTAQATNVIETNQLGDRKRLENEKVVKVVEALAITDCRSDSLTEIAHDARNMVTALGLYCDLLDEPGVLATPFSHYAQELRLVASASRRLVEKLVTLDAHATLTDASSIHQPDARNSRFISEAGNRLIEARADRGTRSPASPTPDSSRGDLLPAMPVANLAAELLANRNLLAALAGPPIALTIDAQGGAQPVRLTTEDLTRVLVNLVKNATEAMPTGGRIHLSLAEQPAATGILPSVALTIEDNGPGISEDELDKIFAPGFTDHGARGEGLGGMLWAHRGLGLAITRSIIEAAGGRIRAFNRPQGGARFLIELPVRKSSYQPSALS